MAFASDFKDVEATTPAALIGSVLELFKPMLHIVNVNKEHYVSLTEEIEAEERKFREMFSNLKQSFISLHE